MHLRFTIRDFLWLAIVLGVAAAWWASNRSLQRKCEQLEDQLLVVEDDYKQLKTSLELGTHILFPPKKPAALGHFIPNIRDTSTPEAEQPAP